MFIQRQLANKEMGRPTEVVLAYVRIQRAPVRLQLSFKNQSLPLSLKKKESIACVGTEHKYRVHCLQRHRDSLQLQPPSAQLQRIQTPFKAAQAQQNNMHKDEKHQNVHLSL
jgi:hypothetical protein